MLLKKKKLKVRWNVIILGFLFLLGLSLLLYPSISNYCNSLHSSKAITDYSGNIDELSDEECEKMFAEAYEFNDSLNDYSKGYSSEEEKESEYNRILNPNGDGMMGYIDIPEIGVELPIYHGSEEDVLQNSAGHISWTSLPVGGESSHSALIAHRGLPSAKLFTDLDELEIGDIFTLTILNKKLSYEIDQILIVLPEDTSALQIVRGEDLCTLITCTPYGINTHRLLVRGHRIENIDDDSINVSSDAVQVNTKIVAVVIFIPIFLLVIIITDQLGKRKRSGRIIKKDKE